MSLSACQAATLPRSCPPSPRPRPIETSRPRPIGTGRPWRSRYCRSPPPRVRKSVNGAAPIRVQFSARLAANTPMPTLSPLITGSWQVEGDTAVFTPAVGYFQDSTVKLTIPGGSNGMISVAGASAGAGGLLASNVTESFTTGSFSTLRLQELLSQLGYLPLTWTQEASPRHRPRQHQGRAGRGVSGARGDVQLELRLPVEPDRSVAGRLGQHPRRRRDPGLRVGDRADHGRRRQAGGLDRPVHRAGEGRAEPERLQLRAGRPELTGDADPSGTTAGWCSGALTNTGIAAVPDRGRHLPRLPEVLLHPTCRAPTLTAVKYNVPVYYANYFNGGDAVHQFDRGQLRVVPEPGLRRAALGCGQDGLRLPLLRHPGHGHRAGGLSARKGRRERVLEAAFLCGGLNPSGVVSVRISDRRPELAMEYVYAGLSVSVTGAGACLPVLRCGETYRANDPDRGPLEPRGQPSGVTMPRRCYRTVILGAHPLTQGN